MSSRVITSLAVLKVNWDVLRKDYLENFVPLLAECIRCEPDEVMSAPSLREQMRKKFGLNLPLNGITTILARAAKRGYLRIENQAYRPNREKLDKLQFQHVQQQVLGMHEALIAKLLRYCNETFQLSWDSKQAETALEAYLEEHQLSIIASAIDHSVIPPPHKADPRSKFFVGSFIKHLQEVEATELSYLETIVKGTMLANAIFLPDPTQAARKFRKTEVYFDTSFLIYALGYAGESRQAPCVELLTLLYETGADLRCFRHTRDEARGILDACAHRIANGRLEEAYGPSIEYFIQEGKTASDIELLAARLERDIHALRIHIVDKPPYKKEFQIDEKLLESHLAKHIPYRNPKACIRDVDSISAIMRRRRLQEYFYIEECRAIFVTTNNELVRLSREFFYQDASPGAISPAISDRTLTNLLWLKKPVHAPGLPRKKIVADCYAATQPDERLWRLYLAEIERLKKLDQVTADDYYLLRHSLEAKAALMELTYGDETAFSQGTIPELLAMVRSKVQAAVRLEMEEERSLRRKAEDELQMVQSERSADVARIRAVSSSFGRAIIRGIQYVTLAGLLFGAMITFPWAFPGLRSAFWYYLASALQVGIAVVSMANLMWGVSIKSVLRRFETKLCQTVEEQLIRLFLRERVK